jgi:hypothetical protein
LQTGAVVSATARKILVVELGDDFITVALAVGGAAFKLLLDGIAILWRWPRGEARIANGNVDIGNLGLVRWWKAGRYCSAPWAQEQ